MSNTVTIYTRIAFKRRKQANIYIFLFFFFGFFPLKKSEPEIVAFNRIVVNYNIHFFILLARRPENWC